MVRHAVTDKSPYIFPTSKLHSVLAFESLMSYNITAHSMHDLIGHSRFQAKFVSLGYKLPQR